MRYHGYMNRYYNLTILSLKKYNINYYYKALKRELL